MAQPIQRPRYTDEAESLGGLAEKHFGADSLGPGFRGTLGKLYQLAKDFEAGSRSGLRLTRAQERSFWILWAWWHELRDRCDLRAETSQMAEGKSYDLEKAGLWSADASSASRLFRLEFGIDESTAAGLLEARKRAAEENACLYIAEAAYRGMSDAEKTNSRSDPKPHKAMLRYNDVSGLHPRCTTGASIDTCHWLSDSDIIPYYLWDIHDRCTIQTSSLTSRPSYVAISHTWGRWRKTTAPVRVPGVEDWLVPENSIFDVRRLPDILASIPVDIPYVWFDLVCIPQGDKNHPIAKQEVGRQAGIFGGARHAIIWLNRLENWDGLQTAVEQMSLTFLNLISVDQPVINVPTGLFANYTYDDSVLSSQLTVDGWFSSLWTLQEICLRPDMWLCNASFELFAVDNGAVPVAFNALVALTAQWHQAWPLPITNRPKLDPVNDDIVPEHRFGELIRYGKFCRGYLELLELFGRTGMVKLHQIRVEDILLFGSNRFCKHSRAEAIMSVLGLEDWAQTATSSTTDPSEWVLGQYPVSFVRTAVSKIGASFFDSHLISSRNAEALLRATSPEPLGALMPFQSLELENARHERTDVKFMLGGWDFTGEEPHPTAKTWEVQADATVKIEQAAIIMTSGDYTISDFDVEISHSHDASTAQKFRFPGADGCIEGLQKRVIAPVRQWMGSYLPFARGYAVELFRWGTEEATHSRGILLKELVQCPGVMLKVGNYVTQDMDYDDDEIDYVASVIPDAITTKVNWTVL